MNSLPDNLSKYYFQLKGSRPSKKANSGNASRSEPDIEVIPKEQADEISLQQQPPPAAPTPPALFNKMTVVVAVVLFLVGLNIPVTLKLLQQQQRPDTSAASLPTPTRKQGLPALPLPTTAPTLAPSKIVLPSPTNPPLQLENQEASAETEATPGGVSSALDIDSDKLAALLIETHAECSPDGACIEIEGPGTDECLIDQDCRATNPASPLSSSNIGGPASVLGELAQLEVSPTAPPLLLPTPTPSPAQAGLPTTIPVPEIPASGNMRETLMGILSGFGVLFLAVVLL